jgi:hypothetical protein
VTAIVSPEDYAAGLELAQSMFDMGEELIKPDTDVWWALEEEIRQGRPHDNWALTFVRRVLEHPELAEGFAAAISDFVPMAFV